MAKATTSKPEVKTIEGDENPAFASNITIKDMDDYNLHIRSLDPKFRNMTFVKPIMGNSLLQIDLCFTELTTSKNPPEGSDQSGQFRIRDREVLPHSTVVLPVELAKILVDQILSFTGLPPHIQQAVQKAQAEFQAQQQTGGGEGEAPKPEEGGEG